MALHLSNDIPIGMRWKAPTSWENRKPVMMFNPEVNFCQLVSCDPVKWRVKTNNSKIEISAKYNPVYQFTAKSEGFGFHALVICPGMDKFHVVGFLAEN